MVWKDKGIHSNFNSSMLVTSRVRDENLIREGVLASYCCSNKLLQTWLKITQMYYITEQ